MCAKTKRKVRRGRAECVGVGFGRKEKKKKNQKKKTKIQNGEVTSHNRSLCVYAIASPGVWTKDLVKRDTLRGKDVWYATTAEAE